jgi:hypothetical protein
MTPPMTQEMQGRGTPPKPLSSQVLYILDDKTNENSYFIDDYTSLYGMEAGSGHF